MGRRSTLLLSAALHSALILGGALTLSPQAGPGQGARADGPVPHARLFPMPRAGLKIPAESTVADLVAGFEEVTGERVLHSVDTRQMMEATTVRLRTGLEVAPADVYSVVQDLLIVNKYALTSVRREEPRMLAVASLDSPQRATIKQGAMYVPISELDDYALDSALLITTVIDLPNADLNSIGASMRMLVMDPNTMQIITISESGQLILTGFGKSVHRLARMLRTIDEGARRLAAANSQEEE